MKIKREMIMEILAARHRLGETIWPFNSKLYKHGVALEEKGYIIMASGNVDDTFRASLTQKGKDKYVSSLYVPPYLRDKS